MKLNDGLKSVAYKMQHYIWNILWLSAMSYFNQAENECERLYAGEQWWKIM